MKIGKELGLQGHLTCSGNEEELGGRVRERKFGKRQGREEEDGRKSGLLIGCRIPLGQELKELQPAGLSADALRGAVFYTVFFFFLRIWICFYLLKIFFTIYLFRLHWVSAAACLSLGAVSGGYSASACAGFSLQWLLVVERRLQQLWLQRL